MHKVSLPLEIGVFIIGAPRTMTTRIVEVMSQHNQLATSDPKESKYFSLHYNDRKYFESHYRHHHMRNLDKRIVVYSNPIDCNMDYVRDRIHDHNPNAKIVMGIRDPIKRAISHYGIHRYKLHMGRVCENIWDELDRNLKNLNPRKFLSEGDFIPYCNSFGSCYVQQYFECSMYFNMYRKWVGHFPSVYVYDYDKMAENFDVEYNKILKYIGVNEYHTQINRTANSLSLYGCNWNMDDMKEEFQQRYPRICGAFSEELFKMSKIVGYDLNAKWSPWK